MESRTTRESSGTRPADRQADRGVLSEQSWLEIARLLEFSARELEVVKGIFDNLKDRAIAARIGISRHTVHTYVGRVYKKLEVTGRVELVIRVLARYMDNRGI